MRTTILGTGEVIELSSPFGTSRATARNDGRIPIRSRRLARAVSYPRRGERNMQNKIIVAAIALVAVFLVGFVP